MIRHIVMWNVNEGVGGRNKEETMDYIKENLEDLLGKIDEINSIKVEKNVLDHPDNRDIVLDVTLNSMEDLKKYANHPEHLRVTDLIIDMLADRVAVDCEI